MDTATKEKIIMSRLVWNKAKDISTVQGLLRASKLAFPAAAPILEVLEAVVG